MSGEGKLTGGGQREETEQCLRTLTDVNSVRMLVREQVFFNKIKQICFSNRNYGTLRILFFFFFLSLSRPRQIIVSSSIRLKNGNR